MHLNVNIHAGPAYLACLTACESACPSFGPFALVCVAGCPVACFAACFGSETQFIVAEEDKCIKKNSPEINIGDTILTLKNGRPMWTTVVRNLKTEGEIECVQIDAQNANGDTKQLKVTPEHGLIVLNQDETMLINAANKIRISDKVITHKGEIFSITNVTRSTMNEKYTLETSEGTVLASGILVTTLCGEEVTDTPQDFDSKMNDWQARHTFAPTK